MKTLVNRAFVRPSAALVLALAGAMAMPACTPDSSARTEQTPPTPVNHLPMLQDWLSGAFSSAKQSMEDPSYFDIHLHITPCWTDRQDGPWLYVEQARVDTLSQPYRQRVYRLSRVDERTYRSDVYEFDGDPLRFAGAWKYPNPLAEISPANLKLKDGCEVVLTWTPEKNAFIGGTVGKGCPSNLRGAAYAVSEVTLTSAGMISWDRGYDAGDQQVWGAVKGGYRFDKAGAVK